MEGSPWGPLAALGVKAGASWNDAYHLCTCPRSSSTPPSRWPGMKKARCLGPRQGSAKVAFSPPAPLAGAWSGTWQWLWGRGVCARAHVGQDRASGEPCTGLRAAPVLGFKGHSLPQASRRPGGCGGRGWGRVPPWGGAPGGSGALSQPLVLCWGLWEGKVTGRAGGPFFLPGQGQDGSWAGLCFLLALTWDRWPRAPPGGPEQGWESLSSRSSQPAPGRGVGELEGGVDGRPQWGQAPGL